MRWSRGVLGVPAFLLTGCAAMHTPDKAANLALDQLARYESDVNAKVRVENDYYDQVMDNAVKRIGRLREGEQRALLEALAAAFGEKHGGAKASSVEADLADFFEASLNDWRDREAAYEQLVATAQNTLLNNRKKLEAEQAKLRQLRVKLRALAEARATADMLKLTVAFAKEVKVKYDALKTDAGKAAEAAGKTAETAAKASDGASK